MTTLSTPRQYDNAVHMMEVLGGSFVRSLADSFYCADSHNKARLIAAFPEQFKRYEDLYAQHTAAREAEKRIAVGSTPAPTVHHLPSDDTEGGVA